MAEIIVDTPTAAAGTYSGNLVQGTNQSEYLLGTDENDIIIGGKGGDIIEGGKGDDTLIGGEYFNSGPQKYHVNSTGADTFVFNFLIESTQGQTYYFRPNDDGTGGDTPNANANPQAWLNYLDQLAAWRAQMEAEYGADTVEVQSLAALTNKKWGGAEYAYDNSFTVAGSLAILDHDGNDTILQFDANGGDKLQLNGLGSLDAASFDELFDVTSAGGVTTLTWAGGSITVQGLTVDDTGFASMEDAFFALKGNVWLA